MSRVAIFIDGGYLDKLLINHDASGKQIFQQKRVDIMLGVDLVQLAATKQINTAILLAGDSDFVPAIKVAKQHGVLVPTCINKRTVKTTQNASKSGLTAYGL